MANGFHEPGAQHYLLSLSDPACALSEHTGSKAARLAVLRQAGFAVPDGVVLTAVALRRFLEANGLGQDSPPQAVECAPLPPDLIEALALIAQRLGDLALAVRSSAIAEDLADASFAGQYETVLNVCGFEALAAAVRHCWASAFSPRVAAYRARRGTAETAGMAILVQHLVPAEMAGVAFTANPVNGDRSETIVSAVRGLGDALVSGERTPDEWVVQDQTARVLQLCEGVLDGPKAMRIAELARQIEAHAGVPQDVEWAMTDELLYVLQARPITGLREPVVRPLPG